LAVNRWRGAALRVDDAPVFGRDKPTGSGLPGGSPSGLGSFSGPSLAKPAALDGSGNTGSLPNSAPSGPWELGPGTTLVFIVLSLVAATIFFAADRNHRKDDPMDQMQRGVLTADSANSFTQPARLDAALAKLEAKVPSDARIQLMSISPGEVTSSMVRADHSMLYATVDASLKADYNVSSIGSEAKGMAISDFDTNLPSRILASAKAKLHLQPHDLDKLSFGTNTLPGTQSYWTINYFKPVLHHEAMAAGDGTDVRLQGTPDAASRKATREAEAAARKASRAAGITP
jgi:hypothetical protein